jgi:hypothetical protein
VIPFLGISPLPHDPAPQHITVQSKEKLASVSRRVSRVGKFAEAQSTFSIFHHSPLTGSTLQNYTGLGLSRKRRVVPKFRNSRLRVFKSGKTSWTKNEHPPAGWRLGLKAKWK